MSREPRDGKPSSAQEDSCKRARFKSAPAHIIGGNSMTEEIQLKDKVEDVITGFTGIVTAKAEYLYGCTQFLVNSKCKDNEQGKTSWIDEPQLKVLKSNGGDKSEPRYGGDRSHP